MIDDEVPQSQRKDFRILVYGEILHLLGGRLGLIQVYVRRLKLSVSSANTEILFQIEQILLGVEMVNNVLSERPFDDEHLHLLRNLVGAILARAKMLKTLLPEVKTQDHEYIRKITRFAGDCYYAILEFEEQSNSSLTQPKTFDLMAQLEKVLSRVIYIPQKVSVKTKYSADSHVIYGYEEQMRDVFIILVHEAIKVISGKGFLTVGTRTVQANDSQEVYLEVELETSKAVIPRDVINRLFPRPVEQGVDFSSLNLHWAHLFLEFIGGQISVEDKPEKGTIFKITIPTDAHAD